METREIKSLSIKPSIWKKAKVYAVKNDIFISEFIENLIEEKVK